MSTLHVVSYSPFTNSCLASCLRVCSAENAILLCGDGTYGLYNATLQTHGVKVFVLAEDIQARNLLLPDWAYDVDYPGFVQLSIDYDKVNIWL
ncbi:sulfurtransferase complex subunit TusB [Candidatus Pseudomonas adelgestsugas]|uniref:Protein TusB n=1 Tax=Candidatus Pseudomonas adelgestsugas TaxID=1302376 RepID=A0ABX5R831_9PSED|nr:sulfurtransferase complex subunit TusB [Candidatus Pseudomonas adelgestsugas]QAX81800.1 Protein TusB [Candidatus Pseudomonas adelgestsugas]